MGEWTIVIQGHGIHDNGRPDDADAICARFVDELARSGEVHSAQFTVGARRTIAGLSIQVDQGAVTNYSRSHEATRLPG